MDAAVPETLTSGNARHPVRLKGKEELNSVKNTTCKGTLKQVDKSLENRFFQYHNRIKISESSSALMSTVVRLDKK